MGWTLVNLANEEFIKKHYDTVFENFEMSDGVNPLLLSQLSIFYYAEEMLAVVNEILEEDG